MRWLAIVLLALALVAVGCGGDDEAASDETTIEETTTDETTTEETTDAGDTTDGEFDFADEDCQALAAAGASIGQAISGNADADAQEAFSTLIDRVPDEIKADVQVLADWYEEYAAEIEDIGLEPGETPSAEQITQLQAALANLDSTEVTEASQRLGVWAQENCTG